MGQKVNDVKKMTLTKNQKKRGDICSCSFTLVISDDRAINLDHPEVKIIAEQRDPIKNLVVE